jgi:hypothetical protein
LVSTGSTAEDLFSDSFLDLEVESGYRDPQKTKTDKGRSPGKSGTAKATGLTGRRSDGARIVGDGSEIGSEILSQSKANSDVLGGSGSFREPGRSSITSRAQATEASRSKIRDATVAGAESKPTINRWMFAVLFVLFLLAIAIGYALAILTS